MNDQNSSAAAQSSDEKIESYGAHQTPTFNRSICTMAACDLQCASFCLQLKSAKHSKDLNTSQASLHRTLFSLENGIWQQHSSRPTGKQRCHSVSQRVRSFEDLNDGLPSFTDRRVSRSNPSNTKVSRKARLQSRVSFAKQAKKSLEHIETTLQSTTRTGVLTDQGQRTSGFVRSSELDEFFFEKYVDPSTKTLGIDVFECRFNLPIDHEPGSNKFPGCIEVERLSIPEDEFSRLGRVLVEHLECSQVISSNSKWSLKD